MLKFIKQHAATIKDIDIYPLFSLLVFVLFFIAVIYYVRKMDKRHVDELKNMPLELDVEPNTPLQTLKQA